MKNKLVHSLACLALLLALPVLLPAQGNPSRGVPHVSGSVTFKNTIGTFTSSHDACTISASESLEDNVLEYVVFTKKKGSSDWVLAGSGTIQEAGYNLSLCYPSTKQVMVMLSCKQKNGGSVTFGSKTCKK